VLGGKLFRNIVFVRGVQVRTCQTYNLRRRSALRVDTYYVLLQLLCIRSSNNDNISQFKMKSSAAVRLQGVSSNLHGSKHGEAHCDLSTLSTCQSIEQTYSFAM
jgi:hypothetical protein